MTYTGWPILCALLIGCGARSALEDVELGGGGQLSTPASGSATTARIAANSGSQASTSGVLFDCPPHTQEILADGQEGLRAITVLGNDVFFRTHFELRRVSKCGGEVTTIAQAKGGFDLMSNARGVVWDHQVGGTTRMMFLPTGSSEPVLVTTEPPDTELWRPNLDTTHAYWLIRPHGSGQGGVFRVPIDNLAQAPALLLALGSSHARIGPLLVNDSAVFLKRGHGGSPFGPLIRIEKDGNDSSTLLESTDNPMRAAIDNEAMYLTVAHGVNEVRRIDLASGKIDVLAEKLETPIAIAVDETRVYFTESQDLVANRVRWVDKTGGFVRILLQGQADPTAVAVDSDAVYFTNRGEGTVVRARKP